MGSISVVLAFLALVSAVSPGTIDTLQGHKARGISKLWETGGGCYARVESCLGTDSWCSRYYSTVNYVSQDECFGDRESPYTTPEKPFPKTDCHDDVGACLQTAGKSLHGRKEQGTRPLDWKVRHTECVADFEDCDGTEAICAAISNPKRRADCFAARGKGPFLLPLSPGCLGPTDTDNENCVGTKEWCRKHKNIYGSEQACLDHRETPASKPSSTPKLPFRQPNLLQCFGDPTEECEGTEVFCCKFTEPSRKQQCFEEREKLQCSVVYSPGCAEKHANPNGESCIGTANWCKSLKSLQMYGSETNCMSVRGSPPEPFDWQHKASNGCSGEDEQCIGTEKVCATLVSPEYRRACLAAREAPPFLLPNTNECLGPDTPDERCMGTEEWCFSHWQKVGYINEMECFELRNLDLWPFTESITQSNLAWAVADVFYKVGANLTTVALLRELVVNAGTDDSAKKAARADLETFMGAVEQSIFNVAEKAIESSLAKYSESR